MRQEQEYPRSLLSRQCIRIRVTNSLTGRSKNFRLTEKDLDDSVLEKVYEAPSAKEVLKWPSEQSEQLEAKLLQIQCVMKRKNQTDKTFSEIDMGKTSIQDIVDFQKEDCGSVDLIQLYLECAPFDETSVKNESEDENCQTPPRILHEVLDMTELGTRLSLSMSPRISSPSILKSPSSCKSASKRVSFGGIPAHLATPTFANEQKEAVSE